MKWRISEFLFLSKFSKGSGWGGGWHVVEFGDGATGSANGSITKFPNCKKVRGHSR